MPASLTCVRDFSATSFEGSSDLWERGSVQVFEAPAMKMTNAPAVLLAVALSGLIGCKTSGLPSESTPTASDPVISVSRAPQPSLTDFADDKIKARAKELLKVRTSAGFPYKDLKGPENGPAVLYLALTAEDKSMKKDALKALPSTYTSSSNSDGRRIVDKPYGDAVLSFLQSENPAEQYYGLLAAKDCFGKDQFPAVKAKVLETAASHPKVGGRYQAFETLGSYGGRTEDPEAVQVYLKGFTDEPPPAYMALKWVTSGFSSTGKKEEVKITLIACLDSQSPAVRGEAIEALAKAFGREPEVFYQRAVDLTKDPSPFVRSKALTALGHVRDAKVYSVIEPLLDDPAETEIDLQVTDLLGKTFSKKLTTFGWGRVDGTALKTLSRVSGSVDKKDKFEMGQVSYKTENEDLAREVKAAKKWLGSKAAKG
jgi:HEAT repeat protein